MTYIEKKKNYSLLEGTFCTVLTRKYKISYTTLTIKKNIFSIGLSILGTLGYSKIHERSAVLKITELYWTALHATVHYHLWRFNIHTAGFSDVDPKWEPLLFASFLYLYIFFNCWSVDEVTNLLVVVSTTACTVMASCYLSVLTYTRTASVVASCYLSVGGLYWNSHRGTELLPVSGGLNYCGSQYYHQRSSLQVVRLWPAATCLWWPLLELVHWSSAATCLWRLAATCQQRWAKLGASELPIPIPIFRLYRLIFFMNFNTYTIASSLQNEDLWAIQ